jgi:3-oxoadipate enol-lactonase
MSTGEGTRVSTGMGARVSTGMGMGLRTRTAGTGPAVLWIHGYTMDSSLWGDLWDLLPGFRHIGVDLPGHGASWPLPAGLTLPALAGEIAALARSVEASRVVALSFGTIVGLQLAIDSPDLVQRLVLGAPTISGWPAEPGISDRYRQLGMLRRFAGPGEQMAELWMSSPPDIFRGTERHPRLRGQIRSVVLRHSWAELVNGRMRPLTEHVQDVTALGRITAHTLVVIGDEDMPTHHRHAETLCSAVPRCRSVTLSGAGHLCLLERPAEVAPVLAEHLRSHEPEANGTLRQPSPPQAMPTA